MLIARRYMAMRHVFYVTSVYKTRCALGLAWPGPLRNGSVVLGLQTKADVSHRGSFSCALLLSGVASTYSGWGDSFSFIDVFNGNFCGCDLSQASQRVSLGLQVRLPSTKQAGTAS